MKVLVPTEKRNVNRNVMQKKHLGDKPLSAPASLNSNNRYDISREP